MCFAFLFVTAMSRALTRYSANVGKLEKMGGKLAEEAFGFRGDIAARFIVVAEERAM